MNREYDVTIRCTGTRLPVILGALDGEELRGVIPVKDEIHTRRTMHYTNGKHDKGITGDKLVLEVMNSEPPRVWTALEMSRKFRDRGFAAGSAHPTLSKMALENPPRVRRVGQGQYCIPGIVVQKGAAAR